MDAIKEELPNREWVWFPFEFVKEGTVEEMIGQFPINFHSKVKYPRKSHDVDTVFIIRCMKILRKNK